MSQVLQTYVVVQKNGEVVAVVDNHREATVMAFNIGADVQPSARYTKGSFRGAVRDFEKSLAEKEVAAG